MNTDRFLTRVFDKQEKKMLYPGDKVHFDSPYIFRYYGIYKDKVYGDSSLILEEEDLDTDERSINIKNFYLKDRFIPMQCMGLKDRSEKLIYGEDIIKTPNHKYICYWDEESGALWFNRFDNECQIMFFDFGCEIEIIGNRWEHPALWEENK